jgi:hypothetical protein
VIGGGKNSDRDGQESDVEKNLATAGHQTRGVADSANLPDPDVIAAEIAEDLQAALDQFTQIAADLKQ